MQEITVEAALPNIETVTEFVNAQLEAWGCPGKARLQIDIAIDELFSNIARYAYGDGAGDATVRFSFDASTRTASVTFVDGGVPFDPVKREDPTLPSSIQETSIGGLGILMVKKTMDELSYRREAGDNVVTFRKSW